MDQTARRRFGATRLATGLLAAALLAASSGLAEATDLLGLYGGVAVGEARVEARGFTNPAPALAPWLEDFAKNHNAYQLMLGLRPIEPFGVEIDYLDLGRASTGLGSSAALPIGYTSSAQLHTTGLAAFGVLYLLPVPILDLYAKVGAARLQSSGTVTVQQTGTGFCPIGASPCLFSAPYRATNTSLAAGLGAQIKLGAFAVRAEYERFAAAGANPSLATIGLTWNFL